MTSSLENILKNFLISKDGFVEVRNITDSQLFDFYITQTIKNNNLLVVLEELRMNSIEHAKSEPNFFFKKESDHFVFIIEDNGFGIHQTLPKNPKLSDTEGRASSSILRLALEESISGTGLQGRGMGLYFLSRLITEIDGECLVASDSGFVSKTNDIYTEKDLLIDIKKNVIIIKINFKGLGL